MCKSSVLAFVLLFAFLFKLEKPSWKLAGIITIITAGLLMMVSDVDMEFEAIGMIEVLTGS
jgi:solute carrier family 35, member C2